MARKPSVTRQALEEAAFELVRQQGFEALNARALAKQAGCSTQPIFSNFGSMDNVVTCVLNTGAKLYNSYMEQELKNTELPLYKASGMAYIKFAKYERNIFQMLFMRDRSHEQSEREYETQMFDSAVPNAMNSTGLEEQQARDFHMKMWIVVHGIASMIATSYADWKLEDASRILTDMFMAMKNSSGSRK